MSKPVGRYPGMEYRRSGPDQPAWAGLLYRDDIEINVFDVEHQFDEWRRAEEAGRAGERAEKSAWVEDEDPWEMYYARWHGMVAPYIQTDGTLDFTRPRLGPGVARAAAPLGATAASWSKIGPVQTFRVENNSTVPYQANVYCLDVHSDGVTVWAGSEGGALFRSGNAGASWTQVGQSVFRSAITAISIRPSNTQRAFVATRDGIYSTFDNGATWLQELGTPDLQIEGLAVGSNVNTPLASSRALSGSGGGVYLRSPSALWSRVLAGQAWDVAFDPTDGTIAYALVSNGTLCQFYKSTDSGATWSVRSTGWLTSGGPSVGARMTASNAAFIYAVVLTNAGPRVLRSGNKGESWTVVTATGSTGRGDCNTGVLGNAQEYYDLAIAADPGNASTVVLGTTDGFRTTDGGATWSAFGDGCQGFTTHVDFQQMVSRAPGVVWIATDGGVTRCSNMSAATPVFTNLTDGLIGSDFLGFGQGWNEDVLVGGRFHNGNCAWHSNYPAGRFRYLGGGETATGYVNPGNSRMVYFSDDGVHGHLLPTTLAGADTLFAVNLFPNETYFATLEYSEMAWDPRCSRTYYIGNGPVLYRTTDNGTTFTPLFTDQGAGALVQHIEVSRADPNVIYLTVQRPGSGALYRSVDCGRSFTECHVPNGLTPTQLRVSQISASGTDPFVLWQCFRDGPTGNKIFRSGDGGTTWENLTTPTIQDIYPVDMLHQLGTEGTLYLLGAGGQMFYRNAGDPDWADYSQGLAKSLGSGHAELSRLAIQYPLGRLRLSSVQGIWETPLATNSSTLPQPMVDDLPGVVNGSTVSFESYSVVNGTATYHWQFFPPPVSVSNPDVRNPTVQFPVSSNQTYWAKLTITDDNGTTSRTVVLNPQTSTCRYAASVGGASSEYGSGWEASSALGPPDLYPAYGDDPRAWASLTPDDQPEWIDLRYNNPIPISYVTVYETLNPGAVTDIVVWNQDHTQSENVYHRSALAQPPNSRILTATFPTTPFPVAGVVVYLDSPGVTGWNEVDAVGIGFCDIAATGSWANSVVAVSSEFNPPPGDWSSAQALGAPNVYPNHSDAPEAWSALDYDASPQFLELGFLPRTANMIRVVETFNPGAVNQLSVWNNDTQQYETVYTANAQALNPESREFDQFFPEPGHTVSKVRIDLDDPAVPGFNEIDAVELAYCACSAATSVDVPPVPVALVSALDWVRPNPFRASTEMQFTLAEGQRVRISIYDLQGRRVARLRDAWLPAGRHMAAWDGRREPDGSAAAAGVYFVRMEARGVSATRKLVRVQ